MAEYPRLTPPENCGVVEAALGSEWLAWWPRAAHQHWSRWLSETEERPPRRHDGWGIRSRSTHCKRALVYTLILYESRTAKASACALVTKPTPLHRSARGLRKRRVVGYTRGVRAGAYLMNRTGRRQRRHRQRLSSGGRWRTAGDRTQSQHRRTCHQLGHSHACKGMHGGRVT